MKRMNLPEEWNAEATYFYRKSPCADTEDVAPTIASCAGRIENSDGPHSNNVPPQFDGQIDLTSEMTVFATARHRKGVNVLFFDSSVRHVRAKDLWSLPPA
jgi:prepilin-type processing-associated H-X9-DG protein